MSEKNWWTHWPKPRKFPPPYPSVEFFTRSTPSVADLLRQAFVKKKNNPSLPNAVVYTAENNNHAAEILEESVGLDLRGRVQFLNTVVGKMSDVVVDEKQIEENVLARMIPMASLAFLVEEFNRILIERIDLPDFQREIEIFEEKDDLLPFEEAKFYGHNAVYALAGYLGNERGFERMDQVLADPDIHRLCRKAFIDESGAALAKRYAGVDPLFTVDGFSAYADALLLRMGRPHLTDPVERIIRDPERKLGWNERLIGAIRLALDEGIEPFCFTLGAAAALRFAYPGVAPNETADVLRRLWKDVPKSEANAVITRIEQSCRNVDIERGTTLHQGLCKM